MIARALFRLPPSKGLSYIKSARFTSNATKIPGSDNGLKTERPMVLSDGTTLVGVSKKGCWRWIPSENPKTLMNNNKPGEVTVVAVSSYSQLNIKNPNTARPFAGRGTYTFPSGSAYSGEWMDGKPNGQGKETTSTGETVEGEFKGNKIYNGKGVTLDFKGGRFEGEWKDGKQHGHGKLTTVDGHILEGEWKEGKFNNGKGIFVHFNGDRFQGEWKEGTMEGYGTAVYRNKDRYEGEWKNDKRHGQGKRTSAAGDVQEGEWRDGLIYNSKGVFVNSHGDRFEGEWKEGVMTGTVVYIDGSRYEGEFKNSKRHGHGKLTTAAGEIREGQWSDGKLQ